MNEQLTISGRLSESIRNAQEILTDFSVHESARVQAYCVERGYLTESVADSCGNADEGFDERMYTGKGRSYGPDDPGPAYDDDEDEDADEDDEGVWHRGYRYSAEHGCCRPIRHESVDESSARPYKM